MKKPLHNLKTYFASLFLLLAFGLSGWGQIGIQTNQTITENFDAIGTSATATLPTNWKINNLTGARVIGNFSDALTTTTQRGGNNMATTASNGRYNFGAGDAASATDRALGGLSSASASQSVNVFLHLKNEGAEDFHILDISYNVEKYRRGSNAAGFRIQLYYSFNGQDWINAGEDFYTYFPSDADNTGFTEAPGATVNIINKQLPVQVTPNQEVYLAWNYSVNSGTTTSNAQALGIDNVSIKALKDENPPIATFNPPDEADGILTNVNPVITFNEIIYTLTGDPVDNTNVAGLITFKRTDATGDNVAFSATIADGKVITVIPDAELDNEQIYYLAVAPVKDAAGNESETYSINFTTIADTAPVMTLTYPLGGEVLYAFDFTTIKWTSENITSVKIEVWVPSQDSWQEIVASTPANAGEFTLQIPEDANYSTKYKIRVSDAATPEAKDESGDFTIIAYAATIADLRNNNAEGDIVKLAGEGVITFKQTFRNQKFIQDATAAVLIDDFNGRITTSFNRGDGIVNLVGKLVYFSNYIQFEPQADPGPGNSPALYTVVPAEITMDQFLNNFSAYESQLVTINEMVRFPAANGTITFSNGGVLDITNDALTGKFRSTFFDVNYIGQVVPANYMIVTGIINERTSSPVGKYITPRDLADLEIFGNDATLSVFTIGGENMLALDGIVVTQPTDKGAFLEVENFAGLVGLVATVNDNNAQRVVMVNDDVIEEADLATLTFESGDAILVTVVAEDTKTTKYYKVTLWDEIPVLTITKPLEGTAFFSLQTLTIEWETNLTGTLYVEVTFPNDMTEIVEEVNAEEEILNIQIPNGIPSGTYKFRLIWKENPAVVSNQISLTATDNIKPSLVMTRPANGAKNVDIDQSLRMIFDEEVFAKAGNIVVKKASDNSVFATVDITGTSVEFDGNEIEINLPDMEYATEYFVLADQGIVMDINGLEFDGIASENTWRFTTAGFYEITILVTDGAAPVEDATVTLYTDPVQTLQTDAEGKVVFEDVPYGWYGLSANKDNYEWFNMSVYADTDKTIPVTLVPIGATTYEVKFEITHKGIPYPWAQVDLQGYGNRWADENGIAIFQNVLPSADIPFTVTNWDIETFEGQVTVTFDNVVVPVSVTRVYQVVFIVTDGSGPVNGALVQFDGQEVTTSSSGYAIFEKVREGTAKPYSISKAGYITGTGTLNVDDYWNQVNVQLEKVKVTITFNISDGTNPLQGALVDLDGVEKVTGADGKAVFTGVEYAIGVPFSISKSGYQSAGGSVDATEDREVSITIQLIKYTVTFTVSHGANPVSGATVTVTGQTPITTNASGVATIDLAPGAYTYGVAATGFVGVSGIGFTVADANLNIPVSLSAVNIDLPGEANNRLLAYPNPSNGVFTMEIRRTMANRISVEVMDITGKLVYRNDYPASGSLKETIDLQHLNKGMYFLRVSEGERVSTMKLIFR